MLDLGALDRISGAVLSAHFSSQSAVARFGGTAVTTHALVGWDPSTTPMDILPWI